MICFHREIEEREQWRLVSGARINGEGVRLEFRVVQWFCKRCGAPRSGENIVIPSAMTGWLPSPR